MELPDFFGLDISSHSIKVVEIKRKGPQAELKHLASVPSTLSIIENVTDETLKGVAELVKQAKQAAGISTVNCVAAIPESPIFSRLLTIPKVEEDKIEETVHWELKSLIPVPLDEVDIAFLEIGEKKENDRPMVDIYVAAAPKSFTKRFQQITEYAGLNLIALETESLANTRSVAFNYAVQGDALILDFGSAGTDIILSRNAVPVFAQTISTGSDALTKAIASDFGIDLQLAEQYKRAYGLKTDAGEGKIAKSIEPVMQILVNEMLRTMTFIKQRLGENGQMQVVISGDAAQLPGLDVYLQQKLNLGVAVGNPLSRIPVANSAKANLEKANPVGFSVAIGLGLKDA